MAKRAGFVSFGFDGQKEVTDALRALGGPVAKRIARLAVRNGGAPVLAAAKRNAPVHDGVLRDAMASRVKEYEEVAVNIIGPESGKAPHAHMVEHGTGPRPAVKGGGSRVVKFGEEFRRVETTGSMPANGFLRRSFEETREQAAAIAKDTTIKALEREAKRKA